MQKTLDITQENCRAILEKMQEGEAYTLLQKIEDKPVQIYKSDYVEGSHSTYNMKLINPKSAYAYRGGNFLRMIIKFKGKPRLCHG